MATDHTDPEAYIGRGDGIDSGLLLNDIRRHQTLIDSYNTRNTAYETLRAAYNTANAASIERYRTMFNTFLTAIVTVPERPCPPDRPLAFETQNKVSTLSGGPTIQFTDDWNTIKTDKAKRGAGMGAPLLTGLGDAV